MSARRRGTSGGRRCRIRPGGIMGILLKPRPPKKTRMTTQQYFALGPSEDCRTLLLYGELIVMPKPKPKHNDLLHGLGEVLRRWIRHMKLGRLFFDNDLIL